MGELGYQVVIEYYRRARVHALPSLLESTGLATLEAASQGANCVVSQNCPVTEYFGRGALCCDPMSIDSIGAAVLKAWKASRRHPGEVPACATATWPAVAEMTLEAYRRVLADPKHASS
jgi:glycosyltransferase involved in cell wall biosynthesis